MSFGLRVSLSSGFSLRSVRQNVPLRAKDSMSEMDQSLPNWVVRDMSGSHPMATEETDIRRRSYAGRAALKAGVSPDSRNQMHLKVLVWHHRLFPGATGDRERHALA